MIGGEAGQGGLRGRAAANRDPIIPVPGSVAVARQIFCVLC